MTDTDKADVVERLARYVQAHPYGNRDLDAAKDIARGLISEFGMTEHADEILRLRAKLDEAREALRFYAENDWSVIRAVIGGANPHRRAQELARDKGERARTTLAALEASDEH